MKVGSGFKTSSASRPYSMKRIFPIYHQGKRKEKVPRGGRGKKHCGKKKRSTAQIPIRSLGGRGKTPSYKEEGAVT